MICSGAKLTLIFKVPFVWTNNTSENSISLDKMLFSIQNYWYFSYFSTKTYCGYSLEVPQRGTSSEYPQHMFSCRNEKNTRYLLLSRSIKRLKQYRSKSKVLIHRLICELYSNVLMYCLNFVSGQSSDRHKQA